MKPTAQRRRDRRALLDNLLGRMLRGRLTPAEAALLAESVREEQRAYDQTRRSLAETGTAYGKHREAADAAIVEAEERARDAEKRLAGYESIFGPNAVDDFHAMQHRAKTAEQRLTRIRSMADAWERRLPAAIRTATAADAVRRAADGDDSPVMFDVTAAEADDDQDAEESRQAWARRVEADLRNALARVDQAEKFAEQWKALAVRRRERVEEAQQRAHRYRTAWRSARRGRRAAEAALAAELPIVQAGQRALALAAEPCVPKGAGAGHPVHELLTALRSSEPHPEPVALVGRYYRSVHETCCPRLHHEWRPGYAAASRRATTEEA